GDHALAPDRDVLEGRDRAFLTQHGLGADLALALVDADLAVVSEPGPAAEPEDGVAADLELDPRRDEAQPVRLQAPAQAQLQPRPAHDQPRVVDVEHPVAAHEARQGERAAVQRLGPAVNGWRGSGPGRNRCHRASRLSSAAPMADSLADRLLRGDKRA